MRARSFLRQNFAVAITLLIAVLGLQLWTIFNPPSATAAPTTTELTLPAGLIAPNNRGINDLAVSADGTKLVIVSGSVLANPIINKIYTSSDSGATWVDTTPTSLSQTSTNYTPTWVASSSSGQQVIVATYASGFVYLSNDYGANWTQKDLTSLRSSCNNGGFLNHNLSNVQSTGFAMSPDGTVIGIGVFNSTCMLVSTDSGANFSKITLPTSLDKQGAIQISQTQNTIWFAKSNTAGTTPAGGLWKLNTTNWTWSGNYSGTVGLPRGLTGSADGTILYTAGGSGYSATASNNFLGVVYRSTDSGATFSPLAGTSKNWFGIKSSADGTKLIGWDLLNTTSNIWISEDSGATWTFQHSPGQYINSVDFSADGTAAYMTMGMYNSPTPTTRVYRYAFPAPSTTTVSAQNSSAVYGASNTLTAIISPNTATGTVFFKSGGVSIGCDTATVTAGVATCTSWKPIVGTYSNITAVYSGDGNLGGSTSPPVSVEITQAPLTITASSPTVIYGASAPIVTASYLGLVNGDATSVVTGLTCTSLYTTTSSAGSLPATSCSGGTAINYSISYVAGTVIINKATPTFSAWSNVSKVYENGDFNLTSPVVTGSLAGTFTYASATPSVISLTDSLATVAGAGTSDITAIFTPTDSTNYNTATTTMTVTVAKVSPRFSTANVTKAFGAAPFSLSNPYVFRLLTGTFTFSSADTSVISLNGRIATVVGVGTSVITATFTPDDINNYLSGATTTFSVSVTQGVQTVALVIDSTSVTYGSTLTLTTTGGSGSGTNSFVVDSGPCTVSGATLTSTAASTCMVTATKAANGNYLASSSVSTAITVNPKVLTVAGLTGANKEFDGTRAGSATGTPSLVGVVGSDNVLLGGTPVFTFASANAGSGISMAASGYTLTETNAANYTLTQPTVTANITAKAARVSANNVTIAFGGTITSGVTASGLIAPDAVGSASYSYTGTGTSTPPTAVGIYTVTPSSAVLSTGTLGNYSFSYDTATVTVLAKYTITYNANGGSISGGSTSSIDFVVGDTALTLPAVTREGFNFLGWYTLQSSGIQVTGSYTPTATTTLWAHWIQKSLVGVGNSQKIGTITTLANVGNTYSATSTSGTVAVTYAANALPVGTVIDIYQMADSSRASSLISSTHNYVLSLVIAWLTPAGTVPLLSANDALTMVITDSAIKKGAKVYSLIGSESTLLGTATADGSVTVRILEDPEVYIAITKPDAPTGVSATSGGDASSTVSWIAPSDGGSAITSYTATSNAGQTCSSATTSCSITGLTNGTPYTFTVTATNAIGTSEPSAPTFSITPVAPAAPVVVTPPAVTAPSSGGGGGGGGSTYVAPTPTVDPAVAAAAAAKALADAKAAEEKAAAEAKALAEKRAAEEAALLAQIKALQDKADADALAAAQKLQEELVVAQLKVEEELKAAAALKLAEEQRIAAERAAAAKKIATVYSTSAAFKMNTTYTKRLFTNTKKIAAGSTVTCIGYAKSSKTLSYAKAKVVATKQAKALCISMKKINPTLMTKSTVLPASKAPVTSVNKKWIPVSYRVQAPIN